jgi:hypothetical protein
MANFLAKHGLAVDEEELLEGTRDEAGNDRQLRRRPVPGEKPRRRLSFIRAGNAAPR